jgi:Flp pilus assembly pilin Flp
MLSLNRSQVGQGLVEYAFILLFVALAVVLILMVYGTTLGNTFSRITNEIGRF